MKNNFLIIFFLMLAFIMKKCCLKLTNFVICLFVTYRLGAGWATSICKKSCGLSAEEQEHILRVIHQAEKVENAEMERIGWVRMKTLRPKISYACLSTGIIHYVRLRYTCLCWYLEGELRNACYVLAFYWFCRLPGQYEDLITTILSENPVA